MSQLPCTGSHTGPRELRVGGVGSASLREGGSQLNLSAQKQQLESSKRELEAQLNEQMRAGQAELDAMVSMQVCMYLCGWARVRVWVGE